MNTDIRLCLTYAFYRRYPALPRYLIEDRVADTLTDMELNPPPDEVRAIPEKYYEWASTVINRALSHEAKRLLQFVTLSDDVIVSSEEIDNMIDQDATEQCLKELPSSEREIVVIRMYTNYNFEKIAKILGKSPR
jgi:DNA-directed RNA polymerase specialized sigma24 family protein